MAQLNHPQMALKMDVSPQPFPPLSCTSVGSALRSENFPDSQSSVPISSHRWMSNKVLDAYSCSVPALRGLGRRPHGECYLSSSAAVPRG